MRIPLNLCCLLVCLAVPVFGQTVDVCQVCAPLPRPNPDTKAGSLDEGHFKFTWMSEYHAFGQTECFYREVTNNRDRVLYYSWPLAQLVRNDALTPHQSDRYCRFGKDKRNPATAGPLFYGRSGNIEDTSVWLSTEESETGQSAATLNDVRRIQHALEPSVVKVQAMLHSGRPSDEGTEENSYQPLVTTFKTRISIRQQRRYVLFIPLPRALRAYSVDLTFSSVVAKGKDEYKVTDSVVSLNKERSIPVFSLQDPPLIKLPSAASFVRVYLKGGNTILVNGKNATNNARITSPSTIETPDQVGATIDLGDAGVVELQPNSKVQLDFDDNGNVKVKVIRGCLVTRKKTNVLPGEMEIYTDQASQKTDKKRRNLGGCFLPNGQLGPLAGTAAASAGPRLKSAVSWILKSLGHLIWSTEPDPDLPISGAGGFDHRYENTVLTQRPLLAHKRFTIKSASGKDVIAVDVPVWTP